jgi:hypothetical protein
VDNFFLTLEIALTEGHNKAVKIECVFSRALCVGAYGFCSSYPPVIHRLSTTYPPAQLKSSLFLRPAIFSVWQKTWSGAGVSVRD